MARFRMDDFRTIENTPTSPATLRGKIGEVILCSTHARARVESVNPVPPGSGSAQGDDQARDVIHPARKQEQEGKQRIGPSIENQAHQGEHQMLRPAWNGVIEQQGDRQEIEEEEKRAEDHLTVG